jgi:3',5'-cyclic AMP phosphodiesterase CpdA
VKILHVSDTHYGQPQAAMRCAPVVSHILEREDIARCVVVHTGDLMETPTRSEMRTAISCWRPVAEACRAFVLCRGNHDVSAKGVFRFVPDSGIWEVAAEGLMSCTTSFAAGPWRIIPADSCVLPPGWRPRIDPQQALAQGYLGPEQRQRICAEVALARASGQLSVVPMHHCPTGGNPALRLLDRLELMEELQDVGGCDVMLTGHLHRSLVRERSYGARVLISSPKTQGSGGYWEIRAAGGAIGHRWVEVA